MNHKRGRKKDSRAGCLLCKPHKANAEVGSERQQRKRYAEREIQESLDAVEAERLEESDSIPD